MAVSDQVVNDRYALYLGDCIEVMGDLPDGSIHLSIFSPPFARSHGGLYVYSSDERDLSNNDSYASFFEHYGYVVEQLFRLTMPGRVMLTHCMDVPTGNTGLDALIDFPGDLIRIHERHGFHYVGRYCVWKEPLTVRNRTLAKGLFHQTIVEDSSRCSLAVADYLLAFRRKGDNPVPIAHPTGFADYAGETPIPAELMRYRGWAGKQTENRYSHWIWRRYASAVWDDVRLDRVLPYREAKDDEDERHVHPLQLDVIDRALVLWSNPGERVLDPFMGVGSTPYAAVRAGRLGVGIELKPSYFRQGVKNLEHALAETPEQPDLFSTAGVTVG